ncbi:MAG TPA: copper transporter [Actinomycetota bacterium]|nr:copper transporter [Actinomycetota bacterium]
MVDFRYHLVSIVAVFLALGIGVLMGSGVVGEPLLDNIRDRARDVQEFNDRLKDDVVDLEHELTVSREFAESVEPMLVEGRLAGEDIVIVDVAAGDAPLDALMEGLEDRAGAEVASIITISDDFELTSEEDVAELGRIVGSGATPEELRVEAATQMGARIAALADGRRGTQDPADLLQELEDAGFLDLAEEEEAAPVPPGASVVIAASGVTDPTFRIDQVVTALGAAAAEGAPVVVVETSDSAWGIVGSVRGDGDLANVIGTVDNVDKLVGRIALAMSLDRLQGGEPGHFGEKSDDVTVIPEPGPRD